ncbi:hypothetical protein [Streptomyces cavernicola]|uniref:ESX-1 secretion-associated protein n=1 Tax=Streptomyces cavernicola TaxID=3043613 RepID=A0ABT6SKQ2_9ACTN|nr:hypothetical protein [Streptomyces sp. B-S-A6]MDI3407831.1 hypothetical protein [Streptomyces sp. B-S-A6]
MAAGTGTGPGPAGPAGAPSIGTAQSGSADNGYGVSNTELGKMADELDDAAEILEKADKGLAESATTARVHSMLTSGKRLRGATADWDDEVTRLAKQCRSLAHKMRETHKNYRAQEERTAQEFAAILGATGREA